MRESAPMVGCRSAIVCLDPRFVDLRTFDSLMTSIPPDDEEKTRVGKAPLDLVLGKSARDRAYLIVLAGDSVGAMYRVEDGETLIGRTSTAKIRLTDDGISRRH